MLKISSKKILESLHCDYLKKTDGSQHFDWMATVLFFAGLIFFVMLMGIYFFVQIYSDNMFLVLKDDVGISKTINREKLDTVADSIKNRSVKLNELIDGNFSVPDPSL